MKKRRNILARHVKRRVCICKSNPLWNFIMAFTVLCAWPFNYVAHKIHLSLKKRGVPTILHHHKAISVTLGILLLLITFTVQNWFHHPVWEAGVETARAAGVCPLWEALAMTLNFGSKV